MVDLTGIETGDLMNAIHARSQLRHRPTLGEEQPTDFSRPEGEGQSVSQNPANFATVAGRRTLREVAK